MTPVKITLNILIILSLATLHGCGINFKKKDATFEPAKPNVSSLPNRDNGAIYQAGMQVGWFQDITAHAVGDVLTIQLTESTNASTSSNTNTSKDQTIEMPGPTLAGQKIKSKEGVEILENNLEAGREFSGQGTSSINSSLNGMITVTVAEVLPNRNLLVKGKKMVNLNQSEEFIRFSGIVRQLDIRPDNTVLSSRVANVFISYSGNGTLNSANSMGSLAKFFQSNAWPY
ncbi:MAG: flagellar basal body L-ring protein FlgH [Gammaproteobacteria bacterium]|nr:flagellar basal body L-ring protein FlgH [Gammaproteobacteria bacterium]